MSTTPVRAVVGVNGQRSYSTALIIGSLAYGDGTIVAAGGMGGLPVAAGVAGSPGSAGHINLNTF
jgi:hypothetical protein